MESQVPLDERHRGGGSGAPAPPAAAAPAPVATAASTPAPTTAKPAASAPAPAPAATTTTAVATPKPAANGRGARGARGQNNANGGRPSLVQAGGYQRVNVNASADQSACPTPACINEMADLSSSADPSLLVSGSVSRGLDMPQQNDWFGGPGGRMDGMGGGRRHGG